MGSQGATDRSMTLHDYRHHTIQTNMVGYAAATTGCACQNMATEQPS